MSQTALAKLEAPEAVDKFIRIYRAVHKVDHEQAKNFFDVEAFNFRRHIEENQSLANCTDLSVAATFLEVISNGLSFEKSSNHVYLVPRNVKSGTGWETRLTYSYAKDGIIYLCTAAGSIRGCTSPVIVYEGDHIEINFADGKLNIIHSPAIPRKSTVILGGYCTVILTNGQRENYWMQVEDTERLKGFSQKANKSQKNPDGVANALYTSGEGGQIDAGFFGTKIVKAALKNFRKKKTLMDNHFDDDLVSEEIKELSPGESATIEADEVTEFSGNGELVF